MQSSCDKDGNSSVQPNSRIWKEGGVNSILGAFMLLQCLEIANEAKKHVVLFWQLWAHQLHISCWAVWKPKGEVTEGYQWTAKEWSCSVRYSSEVQFHTHCRQPDESISTFMAEIRAIADHRNFGQSLNAMLWNRLVCEVNDQKWLLSDTDTTLKNIEKVALAMESAANNALTMVGDKPPKQQFVHKMYKSHKKKPARSTCYRCGSKNHIAALCRCKDHAGLWHNCSCKESLQNY